MTILSHTRFAELDGLRGIAAIWVVVFHFTFGVRTRIGQLPDELIDQIAPWRFNLEGLFAVELFFIISGYVIFMTLKNCRSIADFALSRFARLYPGFWCAVSISYVIILLFPLPSQDVPWWKFAANLTMLHLYFGVPSLEDVYWSLAVEFGFYVMIGIVFACGQLHRINSIGLVWLFAAFVAIKLLPQIGIVLPWRMTTALGLRYASLFFAGILFYQVWSSRLTRGRLVLLLFCYLERIVFEPILTVVLVTGVFGIVIVAVSGAGTILRSAPLRFLGAISYSLYLIHMPTGGRAQIALGEVGLPPSVNLLLSIAMAVACATAITYLVEQPVNRAIRRFYSNRSSLTAAA